MDRTLEFRSFLDMRARDSLKSETKEIENFYKTMYSSFLEICNKSSRVSSYKSLLLLDEELQKLRQKSDLLLGSIQIEGTADAKAHFEGIKHIMGNMVVKAVKQIEISKNKLIGNTIDLEPEISKSFKKGSSKTEKGYNLNNEELSAVEQIKASKTSEEFQALEQENRRIIEHSQYEDTRQRLLKIEAVQRAINENLLIQDERIDSICIENDKTGKTFQDINSFGGLGHGSMLKRIIFVMIMCFTIVLLFLHVYYR